VKGEVLFEQKGHDILVTAFFSELPPGEHGFHIHKAGDLRGEGCKKACDHYHVGPSADHGGAPGSLGSRHTGDLGNIALEQPGNTPFTKTYTLSNLDVSDLYGRSVIVHGDPDDLGMGGYDDSKTTGHSGARIACAIIGRVSCDAIKGGSALFNDNPKGRKPRVPGTGYGTRKKALETIRKLKPEPIGLKRQIATTLYYRAKHHAHQTKNMKEAMKVFSRYLKTLKRK
jgi:Cu-Zn family superoxide dismutase